MKNSNLIEMGAFETLTDEEAVRVTGGELITAAFVGLAIGVAYGIWYFTKGPGSNPAPTPAPEPRRTEFTLPDLNSSGFTPLDLNSR